MSVLINMETPKNCGDCKAFICYRQWAGDVGDCFCGITKNDAKAKEKNADCPLVHVPPHGRLIDADALDDILADQSEDVYNRTHAPRSWEKALSAMRDYLDDAPTIIPASEDSKK